jgi:hypothetical protein
MAALDSLVSLAEQKAWLAGARLREGASTRKQANDPVVYRERVARIVTAPHWRATALFLRRFISECLIDFTRTERVWWSLTAGVNGDYIRLNVGPQELLAISPWEKFDFHILVDRSVAGSIEEAWPGERAALIGPSPYKVVDNQISIDSKEPEFPIRFLATSTAIQAARSLSLALMRARKNIWARSHSSELVSLLLDDKFDVKTASQPREEIPLNTIPADLRSEIERTIWVRRNTLRFSEPVKNLWGRKCALTGIETAEVLEACHIKPWRNSSEAERLDDQNGICLAAHIHKCFDSNLLRVSEAGVVVVSSTISGQERTRLGINVTRLTLSERQAKYFAERYRDSGEQSQQTNPNRKNQ